MREYNHNARITTATLLALLLGAYLYSADTSAEGAVREISRVNGSIRFAEGTRVDGEVRAANGAIRLIQTHVSRDLVTRNGNINLSQGSRVEGDIIVQPRRGWWKGFALFGHRHRPRLRIDETSSVGGDIHLYREVTVDGAGTGEIIRHY